MQEGQLYKFVCMYVCMHFNHGILQCTAQLVKWNWCKHMSVWGECHMCPPKPAWT